MEKEKRTAVLIGAATSFITAFSGSSLNLAIPSMGDYFHMGAASVGWLVSVYILVVAAFSVPIGKIADSTNRKKVLVIGLTMFSISNLICIWASSAAMMLILRVFQGIGSAMIFATNMPIAIAKFPGRERGKAIGIVTSGVYTGLALGPVLGGILNSNFGWKSIFVFATAVSVVAIIVAVTGVDGTQENEGTVHFDLWGNITYVIMICSLIYGLTSLNSVKFGWAFILMGLIFGAIFVKVELAGSHPVIDVRIFRKDSIYTLSNITALFNYAATYALGYMTSIYLQVANGYSSQTAGFVLIAQPVLMAVLSPRMGKLSDRIAPYKLASAGMGLCALSLLSFVFIGVSTPVFVIVIALAVAGTGIALFSSPNTNVIMSRVSPADFGVANAILSTMRTTGQSSGMAIITIVVSAVVGNASLYSVPAEQLIKTMHIGFAIFTVLCILGIFMSLQRKKVTDD